MSSKIASSKYKHAVPKSTRTEWYTDLPVHSEVGSDSSRGIKASRKFIAFPFASAGGSVGVLQLSPTGGKFGKDLPVLSGHTAPVTDLDFSPFDDHLLATASEDTSVKVWRIPEGGLTSSTSDALFTLRGHDKRVEAVAFNTAAGNVLASAGGTSLKLWDVSDGSEKLSISFPEAVLSASWKSDGSMLTTTSKDKKLRTLDPRTSTFAQEAEGHSGVKTSLSIWLGDKEQLLSTGFSKTREREYFLWDTRNLAKPLKSNQLDTSTGVLLPLYDEDSCMLFLGGKGDGVVRWFELVHDKSPYFQWEGSPSMNQEQQKGITLVPKLALNVTKCEVAQVLRLTQNAIVPLSFGVPRKTYSLFHDDLYPDTKWTVPGSTAAEWFAGENKAVPLFPVDPARRPSQPPASSSAPAASSPSAAPATADVPAAAPSNDNLSGTASSSSSSLSSAPASRAESQGEAPKEPEVIAFKDIKYKNTGVRTSKFRYISGKALHPSTNYDHLKDLSLKMSGECDALAASSKLLAVPLNKPGGQIGIIPLSKMGRQPPKLPALVNGGEVLDFVFNPFDPCMLAAACDDSYVRVWKIPEEGLTDDVTECHLKLSGHRHRVNLVRFHPLVSNVLISSSTELGEPSIKYWDLTTGKEMATLGGFQDQVFGFDHNYDGSKLVTVSKDKMIRIFDPRSKKLLAEGPSHDGVRGARVVWCGKTDLICTVGFDRGSQREIRVYNAKDLSKPLGSLTVDVSPGVLVPWFDEDTSVLFLWGRGDSSVSFFEIVDEKPYVHFLTKYEASSLVIGQVFQPKQAVDVKAVEIAKSYVLCQSHIESVSFTVPRTRLEFFQDDIYPPTRDLSKPTMDAPEWFAGATKEAPLVSMQPADMKPVTEAPVEIKPKKYESRKPNELSKEEQEEKVLNDMFKNVRDEAGSGPLPQELKEGVEDSEWD